jgi:hypothetical protein
MGPEMQNVIVQKLVPDVRPLIEPRLQALEAKVRSSLGITAPGAPAASASGAKAAPAKAATPPKKAASK